ncbi:hypothetical protein HPP92_001480 [Vanilla planifolia]|nr:hypothetical protein HPP92_001480 [Vanilla planifolia]
MGKVHGSLARAGKVRGQTPKVTKQDKKKKPRGRAHKRMQYNRRFVTAVVGFGKKRGPNSSEKYGSFNVMTALQVQNIRGGHYLIQSNNVEHNELKDYFGSSDKEYDGDLTANSLDKDD